MKSPLEAAFYRQQPKGEEVVIAGGKIAGNGVLFRWSKEYLDFAEDAQEFASATQAIDIILSHFGDKVSREEVARTIEYLQGDETHDLETACFTWATAILPLKLHLANKTSVHGNKFCWFLEWCLESEFDLRPSAVSVVRLHQVESVFNLIVKSVTIEFAHRPNS